MKLAEPFNPITMVAPNQSSNYQLVRGVIESVDVGPHGFVSEGTLTRTTIPGPNGLPQEQLEDHRVFEGWKSL